MSSTFADLKAERDALAERVFPRLRELCWQNGARFQAVDLRWGVSSEASLDQRAMLICLEELRRCQRISPRPSFVVLLGDRYGWRPLPHAIPGDEFAEIERRSPERYRALLAEWYPRDDNAVVKRGDRVYPEHVLRPRTGEFEDDERWRPVERDLLTALLEATAGMDLTPEARLKYGTSATEQEIAHGALAVPDAGEHVHCYFRRIANFERLVADAPAGERARTFGDFDEAGRLGDESRTRLRSLKSRLEDRLADHFHEYQANWSEDRLTGDHIAGLCEDVYRHLEHIILAEIARLEATGAIEREQAAHDAFASERTVTFVGRKAILDRIGRYVADDDRRPLVLYGPSGSGKSSVMARACAAARSEHPQAILIQRFVGTTARSSDGNALLRSLWEQISEAYGDPGPIPRDENALFSEFATRLGVAQPGRPLIVFLDALDQLPADDPALSLSWLPDELPAHVRVVLSILSDVPPPQVASRLPAKALARLEPMPPEQGGILLDRWLAGAQRALQPQQRRKVLDAFAANGLPLYLKVAFEEARNWRSFMSADRTVLGHDVPGVIRDLLGRLEKDHGPALVERSLGLLGASRSGLSEDELIDVLSCESDVITEFQARSAKSPDLGSRPRLPVIVWSRLFYDLEPYLSERTAEGAMVMSFYHRQLAAGVDARYLAGKEARLARHGALANYFGAQPLLFQRAEDISYNRRKLHELPYQQTLAGAWGALEAVLTDSDFIEAKTHAGRVFDLTRDYARAESAWPGQEEERKKEQGREQRLNQYVAELIDYSCWHQRWRRANWPMHAVRTLLARFRDLLGRKWQLAPVRGAPPLPAPPIVVAEAAESEPIETSCEWTPIERVRAWGRLVSNHIVALAYNMEPAFQVAHNSADSGPVAQSIKERLRQGAGPTRPWLRLINRPPFLPQSACLMTLEGHTDRVTAVAVTADGRRAVSGSHDKTLRVWDLETGHSRVFEGHSSSIYAVAMTPDGRRVVSGGWDKTLRVWELATGHSRVFEAPWSDAAVVHAIAVTPDGRRAVSGTGSGLGRRMDDTLCVWDLETGRSRILKVHTKEFFDVAVTADGRHAVSGRRLWDLETGHSRVFEANMGGVIAVTEDGWRAVSFTADGRVMAQDPKTGYPRTLEGDWLVITAVSLDGRRAVSRENFEICMGDRTVAVTPDGRHAVSVWQWLGGRTVRVWDLETGRWRALDGHMGTVNAVAVTPDGRRAVSGSDDRTVRVWNLEAGRSCAPPEGHNAALGICTVAVARYGQRAFSTGNALDDTTLRVWDLDTGHSRVLEGCTGTVNQLAETPDGRYAIRGSQVWDLETGRVLQGAAGTVNAVTVTPDGRRAVCGSQVWDLETGYPRVPGQKAWALGSVFAVAPDRRCAVGRQEKTLHVWDLATGGCRVFEGHPSNITAVAMTPDGRGVVSGSGWRSSVDRNSPLRTVLKHADLRVWDLATGHSRVLQDFRDDITAVAVTPDGRRAVSGGHDKTLRVWHLETGHSRILEGHTDSVWTVAVTPDGRHAVSGSYDDTLRVWDIETGEVVAIYTSAAGSVDSVAQRFPTLVVKPRRGGCIEILQLMGNNGPRIATAARLWLSAPDTGGGWDSAFTAVCDACGRRFSAPAAVLDSITAITRDARLGPNDSPCLNLPAEAWAEPHLLSECPLCHEPLKFNPFVVDNRDRYSAP